MESRLPRCDRGRDLRPDMVFRHVTLLIKIRTKPAHREETWLQRATREDTRSQREQENERQGRVSVAQGQRRTHPSAGARQGARQTTGNPRTMVRELAGSPLLNHLCNLLRLDSTSPLRNSPASFKCCISSKNTAVPGGTRSSSVVANSTGEVNASCSANSSQFT